MAHQDFINEATARYTAEELAEIYVDTTLDINDQIPLSLANHIEISEDWCFQSHSINCDIRHASSAQDLLDYINTALKKV